LAEWKVVENQEIEEKFEGDFEETLEEIIVEADEGEMITLSTNHPPKSHNHLSVLLTFHDPLPKVPSSRIRTYKEWNLDASKGVPPKPESNQHE